MKWEEDDGQSLLVWVKVPHLVGGSYDLEVAYCVGADGIESDLEVVVGDVVGIQDLLAFLD